MTDQNMTDRNMSEENITSSRRPAFQRDKTPVPEFYMPAMPPIHLTEALDRWLRLWFRRRKFCRLLRFDDRSLAILGLNREDVRWAARQPIKTDAFEALERRQAR
ncbi:hypothetical protein [Marinobacter fonticola]|uniref:hypothetical protein n=1 Tax=Marinobacter fonticola TaxID=2603215 RepID=UPI0011E780EE|nr:hypothetical protein [Marinobacter fonticola]